MKEGRFKKKPTSWETAKKRAWKEFFEHHPEYKDIRNWQRSVTIGKNIRHYGKEIKPMHHPCPGARKNTGNALLIGVHATTPRGVLITRLAGETENSYMFTVNLPGYEDQAAKWNKLTVEEREGFLGCEFCDVCIFQDRITFIKNEKGDQLIQFTEDILLNEEDFERAADLFCELEENLSIKKKIKLPDGRVVQVPQQRELVVPMSVLDQGVENEFMSYARKYAS
jgi:hypothetical protein